MIGSTGNSGVLVVDDNPLPQMWHIICSNHPNTGTIVPFEQSLKNTARYIYVIDKDGVI